MHSFRQHLKKAKLDTRFLINVYGRGYQIGAATSQSQKRMSQEDRLNVLRAALPTSGEVSAQTLIGQFGYSARQAQRDLQLLVTTGELQPVGGRKNRRYLVRRSA